MIIVIMGVSGAGKSTIGKALAVELEWSFYEGDDFHPKTNIEKMANGIALSDEDRAIWLSKLSELVHELAKNNQPAVITCSALKKAYRERLSDPLAEVRFVFLRGSYDLILERINKRQGHYMRAGMLQSQFDILEPPEQALTVDVSNEQEIILRQIRKAYNI
jgi:carbohydrate kinase (thermoresistant glucokinase family)